MKTETSGWVVAAFNHPSNGKDYIVSGTFSHLRSNAIRKFVSGSGAKWEYWKRKYNFRCVKAKSIIQTLN